MFFQELGADVVVSANTSRSTMNSGSRLDEVCLPAKVYFGHVCELYKHVDYLFTPRIISVAAGQYTCPKIIGMPDMLRSNIDNLPPLIDVNLNLRQNSRSLYQAIVNVGHILGKNAVSSLYAWYHAWQYWRLHQAIHFCKPNNGQYIGLISHPYVINDRQIGMNVINKIENFGINVITAEMVSNRQATVAAKTLRKKIFWSNGCHMVGSALALIQSEQPVDGLIFMTTFSCGPDALIGELISQRAQTLNIPCMLLTVDEHTAEAGFVTRLEAFTDMLIRRRRL